MNSTPTGYKSKFEYLEENQPELLAYMIGIIALHEGLSDRCPKCYKMLTGMTKIERNVYGSCGCMLYQGSVVERWDKPLDTVEIHFPTENLSWWERIIYEVLRRF